MSVNFDTVTTVIMALPKPTSACATQELYTWIDSKQIDATIFRFSQGKILFSTPDFNQQAVMHTVARIAAIVFIFPVIGTLAATYNAGAGVLKIGLGIVTFMRKDSSTSEEQIKEGLEHLLTAIYDYALTSFFTRILRGLGYGIAPEVLKSSHQKLEVGYHESKPSSESNMATKSGPLNSRSSNPSTNQMSAFNVGDSNEVTYTRVWIPSMIKQAADSIYTATLSQQSSLAGWIASRQAQS